jgi:hypothetical protein
VQLANCLLLWGLNVTDDSMELEGLTEDVYLYAVRKGKPVGPRDVMKGVNLSSPSVAYRHLQKLEDMEYLQKDAYGEYTIKTKAHIAGYIWFGKRLIPQIWRYSLVFLCVLIVEAIVFFLHYPVENYEFKVFFVLLMLITGLALMVFTIEGLIQNRRKYRNKHQS